MSKSYSDKSKKQLYAVSAKELPLFLLEIHHRALSEPARMVQDNAPLKHRGNEYQALGFKITPPDDLSGSMPKAKLSIDNVSKELVQLLELSNGARGATCVIKQVLRSTPNVVESELTLNLSNVEIDIHEVRAQLGYSDFTNQIAVVKRYDPQTSPALY